MPLPGACARKPQFFTNARAAAPFLAQLAATRLGLPQTRQRRRASITDTVERYDGAHHLADGPVRGILLRKVI